MTRLLAAAAVFAASCRGQFVAMELQFEGTGCASCAESIPARIKRMRGVDSVKLDAAKGSLAITLTGQNRVRLEQVRDVLEQDGTKAKRASVTIRGTAAKSDSAWTLQSSALPAPYGLEGTGLQAGESLIQGEVLALHPAAGPLVISVREQKMLP